jgi:hypothetical protein
MHGFDERLAERVHADLAGQDDVREQRMFGGPAFWSGPDDRRCHP